MATTTERTFDRLEQFDEASRQYPVRALVRSTSKPRSYSWLGGPVTDQGKEGACVGFGWTDDVMARPKPCTIDGDPNKYALGVYHAAQAIDGMPMPHEGSSVLAGAKVMQSRGIVSAYHWAFGIDDVVLALGYKGPVVLGIPWYDAMYEAPGGIVRVGGSVVGGHCILARAVNVKKRLITLRNSWGVDWGVNGDAQIGFDDLARLLKENGEACVPVHRAVKMAA